MFAASRWKHSYDSSWPHVQEERAVNLLLISLAMAAAVPIEGGGEGNLKCLGCDQDYVEEDFHQADKNVTRVFGLRNLVESKSVLYEWLLALYIPKFWKARHSHSTKESWKVEVRSYLTKIRECSKFKWSNSNTHTHMSVRFAASKTCAVHSNKAKDHCPKCSKKVRNVVRQNPDAGIRAWFHGLILRLQSCWVLRRMALHENTVQLLGEPDSTLPYVVCTFKLLHEVSQLDLDWEPESERCVFFFKEGYKYPSLPADHDQLVGGWLQALGKWDSRQPGPKGQGWTSCWCPKERELHPSD